MLAMDIIGIWLAPTISGTKMGLEALTLGQLGRLCAFAVPCELIFSTFVMDLCLGLT